MRRHLQILAAWMLLVLTACGPGAEAAPIPSGPSVIGVFEGTTPCSRLTRPLPQVPEDTDCEQMIWKLTLHQDPVTGDPTTYELNSAFGVSKQGTQELVGGGTQVAMEGRWEMARGTRSDPDAVVYQLNPNDPSAIISFQEISDDILHLLSRDGELVVGGGAWAYTLNRMDEGIPSQAQHTPVTPPEPRPRPPIPPTPAGASVHGTFDGRTPCAEIALALTKSTSFPGCERVKWRLILYQDRATGAPSTYLSIGTQDFTHGTWSILERPESHPDAILYQLDPEDSDKPVFFLRADDNHLFLLDEEQDLLVGNAHFSYTLSRIVKAAAKPDPYQGGR